MDKVNLPSAPIGEEKLAFVPVKNVGKRSFSLALADGELILYSKGKKYKIILTEEVE